MRLKAKTAIVTGAGGGIGRASALLFAREGARVVVHGKREENTKETYDLLKEEGHDAIYFLGDARKEEDMKGLVVKARDTYGRIDILFNNAGVGYSSPLKFGPLKDVSTQDWDSVFEINLRSIFFTCKYAIPIMIEQRGGVILNCGSINGVIGCGADSYSATKGGIIALTRALAVDNGKYNIRVNTVSPAATRTPMISKLLDEDREFYEKWSNMPVRGIIEPEDIANAALFLVCDESRFITGQNLVVDGGCSIM